MIISYSNKTKGNAPNFLLELVVSDLFALKLRGDSARQPSGQVVVWFISLFPLHSRLHSSQGWEFVPSSKAKNLAQVASFTQTHFWGFGFHDALKEHKKHLSWIRRTRKLQVYMYVIWAGRVPESDKVCYLCCLGQHYNPGHGILSRSGNTNLRWPSELKELLYIAMVHWLCNSFNQKNPARL